MVEQLARLEEAEELAIGLLESAGQAMAELKEVQANDGDKNYAFASYTDEYYKKLVNIRNILMEELNDMASSSTVSVRRPGVDQLAIRQWEAKVIADNLHDLITH